MSLRTELLYKENFPVDGQTRFENSSSQIIIQFAQCTAINETPALTVINCGFYLSFFLLALALDSSSSSEYSMT